MKSKLLQMTVGTLLALLMLCGAVQICVSGQDKENGSPPKTFGNSRPSIEGV